MLRCVRRTVVLAGVVAVAAMLYLAVTAVQVWQVGRTDQTREVDVIVVLGAAQYDGRPSPQLQARLDRAVELFRDGWAPAIAVTGGSMPGDRFTEAEASRRYLERQGVPPDAITGENEGRSTWESLQRLGEVLERENRMRVLLVSDPFHLLRVRLSASEVGLTVASTPTRNGSVRGFDNVRRHVKEAVGVAMGRVIGFERLWRITG
jgi:uncharacterized SAM-binding protein YcdF (DUF218 family)